MWRRITGYGIAALLGIACAWGFFSVFFITTVTGSGMAPAYREGAHVLVNRMAYEKKMPQAGDVVAIRNQVYSEDGEGCILIRRVAACQGDRIEIRDNVFYRNGTADTAYMQEEAGMEDLPLQKLGRNAVFLLCDDRRVETDSRSETIGIVKVEDCMGKVCFP